MRINPARLTRSIRAAWTFGVPLAKARWHGRSLRCVHDNKARIRSSDVLLVCCLRNERVRMPVFLDYYRKMGVDHFLIVDNDSDDGFVDWVCQFEDVSVWTTTASYKAANFGMHWCNYLLGRYGSGHLCVTVDPDEFLVYPFMETRSLRALGQFLRDEGRASLAVVMLDAYSDKPIAETIYEEGADPFAVCPYFDRDGYIQTKGWGRSTHVRGGPRLRVYFRDNLSHAPALNKIPVVWWEWYYSYRSSMHDARPWRLNEAHTPGDISPTGCLFHFKFFAQLIDKSGEERQRNQHYAGGREYRQYHDAGSLNMYEEGVSVRYSSTRQLVDLGLMSPGDWF